MGKEIRRGLFAVAMGILTMLVVTGFFSWAIIRQWLDIKHMDLMAAGVLIAASAMVAMVSARGEGIAKRVVTGELGFGVFLAVLNLGLFDGNLSGCIPCIVLIAGTSAAVMLMRMEKSGKESGASKYKKRRMGRLNKKRIR